MQILILFVGFFSGLFVAKVLSTEERGLLGIYMLVPSVMGTLMHFGAPQSVGLYLASDKNKSGFISSGIFVAIILSVLGCISGSASIKAIYFANPKAIYFSGIALISPGMILAPFAYSMLRSLGYLAEANRIQLFSALAYSVALLLLWIIGVESPINIAIVSVAIPLLISVYIFVQLLKTHPFVLPSYENINKIIKGGLAFYFPLISFLIYQTSDRFFLIRIANLETIGLYSVAYSISFPSYVILENLGQVYLVRLLGSDEGAQKVIFQSLTVTLFLAVLFYIASYIFISPFLFFLFGTKYAASTSIIRYLLPALSLMAINRMQDNFLRGRGKEKFSIYVWLIATIFVFLGSMAAFYFDNTDAFYASLCISELLVFFLLIFAVIKVFDLRVNG